MKKWNPLWWVQNDDDPVPPPWYLPRRLAWWRQVRWWCRNPLHNFFFYVVGVADRPDLPRTGKYPQYVFAPAGWNYAVTWVGGWLPLPFVSYNGTRWEWYVGWRERGNFGVAARRS